MDSFDAGGRIALCEYCLSEGNGGRELCTRFVKDGEHVLIPKHKHTST